MTELEYIQNHIKIVRQQVNHSQVRFLITDPVKKASYDFYENELQTLESIEKSLKALEIIKEYQVDVWLLKQCDHENYIRIRKKAMVSVGQIVNENGTILEDEITEEEFNLLKEVLV